jgi:hypothetical protein
LGERKDIVATAKCPLERITQLSKRHNGSWPRDLDFTNPLYQNNAVPSLCGLNLPIRLFSILVSSAIIVNNKQRACSNHHFNSHYFRNSLQQILTEKT